MLPSKLFFKKNLRNLFEQVERQFSITSSIYSEAHIIKSASSDIVLPESNRTLPEVIFSSIEPYHNLIAIECALTRKKYTYGQVRNKSFNFGKMLRKHFKLGKGDVVGVYLPNCPDYLIACLGTLSGGLVLTTVNALYTAEEVSKQLLDSNAKLIVTQTSSYEKIMHARKSIGVQIPILVVKEKESDNIPNGAISFEEITSQTVDDLPDIVPGKSSDLAYLPYSSGTMGLPKGVLLSHGNLIAHLNQINHPDYKLNSFPEGDKQDNVAMIVPMYHIFGFARGLMINIFNAGKAITLPNFTPSNFITMFKNYKITHLYAAPPLMFFITTHPDVKSEYFESLKIACCGGAPLGYTDEVKFREKLENPDVSIHQGYGLTETAAIIHTPSSVKLTESNGGSVGKVISNTVVKLMAPDDPKGTPLGPNMEGELLVKGPQITEGYLNRPQETEKAFVDGWFRTGDISYYDDNNFFFISDRLKELIKVRGFQVAPAELEALIRSHPAVDDAAVIGIPDPRHGELPRAYVVKKKNEKLAPEELQQFVASKVAKYKQLIGGVQMLDAIPKSPAGKILRRELKEAFKAKEI